MRGAGRERHGDLKLAALAMTEIGDQHIGALGKTDAGKRHARRFAQRRLAPGIMPEAERMAGMRLNRERDIVERSEIGEQRRDLKRAREPDLAAAGRPAAP